MTETTAQTGTPPDGWMFVRHADLGPQPEKALAKQMQSRQPEMTHCRWTVVGAPGSLPDHELGVWLEFWRVQPAHPAPFKLPPKDEPRR